MHHVGHDMVEQPLVVGNHHHGAVRPTQPVDAIGHDLQRVDVEAGIGFVQHAEPRLQQRHLQDFVALLFAAGEPDVYATAQHIHVDLKLAGGVPHQLQEFGGRQLCFAALLALRVERGAQERHGGDARNFERILERQEQALGGALVRLHLQNVLAVEQDLAFGRLVAGFAGHHIGERRLARAVRAHDGVHLTLVHGEVETVEDLLAVDRDVQILDFKHWHFE